MNLVHRPSLAAASIGLLAACGKLGRYADIIAVDGNPLDDVAILVNGRFVMRGGVIYKQ